MSVFKEGSNRERIHSTLTDKPITVHEVCALSGLSEKDSGEILNQISRLGHSERKVMVDGSRGWVKGSGVPPVKSKTSKPKTGTGKKVREYLKNNVGEQVSIAGIVKALKLSSSTYPSAIMAELAKKGDLTRISDVKPFAWVINPSINDNKQTEMLPPTQPPANTMPSPYIMPNEAPMGSSSAISALMQMENKNIMYEQGLMQIMNLYNQLGNVLETMGLLEE